MEITLNGLERPDCDNMLTFTGVPNLVNVHQDIYAYVTQMPWIEIEINQGLYETVSADGQYYYTLLGETITSTRQPSNAKNKRFFISQDEDSTAYSMCLALRNCSSISAQFKIISDGETVRLMSKSYTTVLQGQNLVQTNFPEGIVETSMGIGTITDSTAKDFIDSKIILDIYKDSYNDRDYVTSLEKNFYGEDCGFDISPVLSTFTNYSASTNYYINVSQMFGGMNSSIEGDYRHLGSVSGTSAIGYLANQSDKYLFMEDVQMLMHNWRNGEKMIRYVYGDTIPYSVLVGNIGGWDVWIKYLDSAFNQIGNIEHIADHRYSSSHILERGITIKDEYRSTVAYIDIWFGDEQTPDEEKYRFNVIKPLKATEYYQRVFWYNEYNGISFFDFTGARTESDSVDIDTYEKNIFDYYDTNEFERKIIYKNNYQKTVKLTSHLMEEGGRWIFNSLMRSKKVWTIVNGKKYFIIPTAIEINEDSNINNVYKATFTYQYSDL